MTLLGSRTPRLRAVPPYERTYGPDVRDLAALAGLQLDPWQADVLDDFCAESPTEPGRWNALECAVVVPRQNGKGGLLEAYVLAALFLDGAPLTMYSAHRFDTAREMFLRIKGLIAATPSLERRVRKVSEAHGKEGIELRSGERLKFHARSQSAARGFSGDRVVLDEAFLLTSATMGAILPTLSARPNPQVVYASSAGWEISEQLGRVRRRALAAIAADRPEPGLAFLEWSAPDDTPRNRAAMDDPALWAQANPAMGIRIEPEFIAAELRTMGTTEFARERLGVSDYPPDEEEGGWEVIAEQAWRDRAIEGAAPRPGDEGPRRPAFAVDMTPDRSMASIGAAFEDEAGVLVAEVIGHAQGSGWVVPRLVELCERYEVCAVAIDKGGPAASLLADLERAGIEVMALGSGDVAQAYGQFIDGVTDARTLVHLDQEPLTEAVKGAGSRPLGDRQTWDRRGEADISPLVAVTNAAYAHGRTAHETADPLADIW